MCLLAASYNIHRCYGLDRNYNPARVRKVLREINADIIALQEVELLNDNPGLLDFFCEDQSWEAVHGLTMSRDAGHYGNAILTKLPIIHIEKLDLSFPGREPRGAVSVIMQKDDLHIHVIATHLGLRPGERRFQAKRLLQFYHTQRELLEKNDISLLMGDLNEWFLWGRPIRWLQRYFKFNQRPASFPAKYPFLSLDRILVKPANKVDSVTAWSTPLSKIASDHLPVIARIT